MIVYRTNRDKPELSRYTLFSAIEDNGPDNWIREEDNIIIDVPEEYDRRKLEIQEGVSGPALKKRNRIRYPYLI